MKTFFRQQLARYTDRLAELESLLSREDIMKDMNKSQNFRASTPTWRPSPPAGRATSNVRLIGGRPGDA